MQTEVGLRIDVDTLRGTREGVPRLLEILARHNISASFFFSVGPDNMGRHLWRLIKPAFLKKMLRSRAASLYGWDILLAGTFWPGRKIGLRMSKVIAQAHQAGHEIGLHAWDHYKWQTHVDDMPQANIKSELQKAYDALHTITGCEPRCSAVAGWKCNENVLAVKEGYAFHYNSDCRGTSIFRPLVNGRPGIPQVPVTLPTYDELIGGNDVTHENYNTTLLDMIRPGQLNVLTIHAEVEGIVCAGLFQQFLLMAGERNVSFVPLGTLLSDPEEIPVGTVMNAVMPGREGWLCQQHCLSKS